MARTTQIISLCELPLFHGLEPEQLARVEGLLHCKTVGTGTPLLLAGQPGEAAYIIASGTVRIHAEQPDGSDVSLAIVGPGEVIGEMGLLPGQVRSASAVTLESTTLYWMDRVTFVQCLRTVPQMALNLVDILARRLRLADARFCSLATRGVHGRVAFELVNLAREYGRRDGSGVLVPMRLTQSDLASLVGASRARVNSALAELRRHNAIAIDRRYRITIYNVALLEQRCL